MKRLLTRPELNALLSVIDYVIEDEREDYESYDIPPEDHIYLDIRTLVQAVKEDA